MRGRNMTGGSRVQVDIRGGDDVKVEAKIWRVKSDNMLEMFRYKELARQGEGVNRIISEEFWCRRWHYINRSSTGEKRWPDY